MDALAGYGSDSESDEDVKTSAGGALSGLLGHYSDDSDANEEDVTKDHQKGSNGKETETSPSVDGGEDGKVMADRKHANGAGDGKQADLDGHPKKRRRRWDNPNEDASGISINADDVLPPPTLLKKSDNKDADDEPKIGDDPFHSALLFKKDYTKSLRQTLSRQLISQQQAKGKDMPKEKQQRNEKLEQLHNKFRQKNQAGTDTTSSSSSFAAHLKSQHEFGNPHLLKSVIDHFNISPLDSNVGNSFKRFEYLERLMSAEERARIAAANYNGV